MKKIISLVLVLVLALTAIGGTLAYFTDTDEVKNTFVTGNVKLTLDEADITNPDGPRVHNNEYTTPFMPGVSFVKDPTVHVGETSQDSYLFMDVSMNKFMSLFPVIAQNALPEENVVDASGNVTATGWKTFMKADGKFSTKNFIQWMIENDKQAILDDWFKGITHSDWRVMGIYYNTAVEGEGTTFMVVRLGYIGGDGKIHAGDNIKFMNSIDMPETVTQEMIENTKTGVNAFNKDGHGFLLNFKAYAIQAAELETLDDAYIALFEDDTTYDATTWIPVEPAVASPVAP